MRAVNAECPRVSVSAHSAVNAESVECLRDNVRARPNKNREETKEDARFAK